MRTKRDINDSKLLVSGLTPIINQPDNFMGMAALDGDLQYYYRRRLHSTAKVMRQTYAQYWILLRFHNCPKGALTLRLDHHITPAEGSFYLYIPARSYAEWHIRPHLSEYETYISFTPADECFPTVPTIFPCHDFAPLTSYDDIANLFMAQRTHHPELQNDASYVSSKTKRFLDRYFREDLSFEHIATDLNMGYSTMAMGFKKDYGIAPVQYRNILRTFEAMRLIKNGHNVTQAGLEAGFTSLAQYNVHFHRNLGVPPSTFVKLAAH
ncbi:MAG: AraC family transcriptional regulator [Alphaproteobacteria bacterium]|nr:AraC family transcriptional regulator [Alphaproteobacteria bacterium]